MAISVSSAPGYRYIKNGSLAGDDFPGENCSCSLRLCGEFSVGFSPRRRKGRQENAMNSMCAMRVQDQESFGVVDVDGVEQPHRQEPVLRTPSLGTLRQVDLKVADTSVADSERCESSRPQCPAPDSALGRCVLPRPGQRQLDL